MGIGTGTDVLVGARVGAGTEVGGGDGIGVGVPVGSGVVGTGVPEGSDGGVGTEAEAAAGVEAGIGDGFDSGAGVDVVQATPIASSAITVANLALPVLRRNRDMGNPLEALDVGRLSQLP